MLPTVGVDGIHSRSGGKCLVFLPLLPYRWQAALVTPRPASAARLLILSSINICPKLLKTHLLNNSVPYGMAAPTPFNERLPPEIRRDIWDWSCLPEPGLYRPIDSVWHFEDGAYAWGMELADWEHQSLAPAWTVRKSRYPVALHVDRSSRESAQSVQQREELHATRRG